MIMKAWKFLGQKLKVIPLDLELNLRKGTSSFNKN